MGANSGDRHKLSGKRGEFAGWSGAFALKMLNLYGRPSVGAPPQLSRCGGARRGAHGVMPVQVAHHVVRIKLADRSEGGAGPLTPHGEELIEMRE